MAHHYYFCCRSCRDKFAANPTAFLSGSPGQRSGSGHSPSKVSADRVRPPTRPISARCIRKSGSAGRAVVPSAAWRWSRSRRGRRWSELNTPARCIRRSCGPSRAACPICGMALEPRTVVGGRIESRTGRHVAPVLGERGADAAAVSARHVADGFGRPVPRLASRAELFLC